MCIAHWSPPDDIRRLRLERHGVELHLRIFIRSVFTSPGNRAVRTELQTTALWQKLLQRLLQTTLVETIVETIAIYTGGVCSALYASPHRGGGAGQGEQNCRQLHSSRNYCELLCFIPPPNSSTGKWGRLQYSPPSCFHSSRWRQQHSMPMAANSIAFMFLLQY